MTYFKAKADAYDYFSKRGVVAGELLTAKERNSLVRYLSDDLFETVVIPKSKTFSSFGVRFEVNRNNEGR